MGNKKYDPLWELVGEKVALQGHELDVDARCPHCNVGLRLGSDVQDGSRVACGLCGGTSIVERHGDSVTLKAVSLEEKAG